MPKLIYHKIIYHLIFIGKEDNYYANLCQKIVLLYFLQIHTVEPGIYIPEGSPCDEKWWGIAVRIEDCILVTKDDPVNFSGMAPRTSDDIEEMMKEESILNAFKLPKLD